MQGCLTNLMLAYESTGNWVLFPSSVEGCLTHFLYHTEEVAQLWKENSPKGLKKSRHYVIKKKPGYMALSLTS